MKDQKRILGVNTDNYDNLALALFTTENKASIRATAKFITECFILIYFVLLLVMIDSVN